MKKGFTIVELLIVIVVIAILAAIVTVAYGGITRSANESSVKSDLRNTASKLAIFNTDNGAFPAVLDDLKIPDSQANKLQYSSDGATYCLAGTTKAANGPSFYITNDGTLQNGTCPLTWTQVAAGAGYTVGLASNGKLYTWGGDEYGQLGNGATTGSVATPTNISDGSILAGKAIKQISAGEYHVLVLTSDGKVYGWGHNTNGQLGIYSYADQTDPIAIEGALAGKTVTQVAAGSGHSLALTSDGSVYAWGTNSNGEVGDGTTTRRIGPVAITNSGALAGKTVAKISAGGIFSLAVDTTGNVYSWGYGYNDRLGTGTTNDRYAPVAISSSGALAGKHIIAAEAGNEHSLVVDDAGALYGWGVGYYGQLGTGSSSSTPVVLSASGVLAGKTISQIAVGGADSFVVADGALYGFGYNFFGGIGNGTQSIQYTPLNLSGQGSIMGKTIVRVAAGNYTSFALDANGKLYGWGFNYYGNVGDGSSGNNRLNPVGVLDPQ